MILCSRNIYYYYLIVFPFILETVIHVFSIIKKKKKEIEIVYNIIN